MAAADVLRERLMEICLPSKPESAETARRYVKNRLLVMGCHECVDDALIITSELVSNAIRHVKQETFKINIRNNFGHPFVEVYDHSTALPKIADRGLVESGRGLVLVTELAVDWGVDVLSTGKTVWAIFK